MLYAERLTLKYTNPERVVFSDLSFELKKGSVVAVTGRSGSGKTSLLNLISGMLSEDSFESEGKLYFDGKPLIRYVFQTPRLLPWRTVSENIAFGLEMQKLARPVIDARVKEALKLVRLEPFAGYLPGKLSVGMQQRVNFARALVCEPELLLLDEPFSALDARTRLELADEFLKIIKSKNITAMLVTHDPVEARNLGDSILNLGDEI